MSKTQSPGAQSVEETYMNQQLECNVLGTIIGVNLDVKGVEVCGQEWGCLCSHPWRKGHLR